MVGGFWNVFARILCTDVHTSLDFDVINNKLGLELKAGEVVVIPDKLYTFVAKR